MFWNKRDLYVGYDLKEYNAIKTILSVNQIKFDCKAVNRGGYGLNNRRSYSGTFGESPALENTYYISVKKKDYDQAVFLINQKK